MRRSISTCRADLVLTGVTFRTRCLCQGLCSLAMAMADSVAREAEVSLGHQDGHRLPVLVRIGALKHRQGRVMGDIELFTNLGNILANSCGIKQLEQPALLDNLTQLATRSYLQRGIEARFEEMWGDGVFSACSSWHRLFQAALRYLRLRCRRRCAQISS